LKNYASHNLKVILFSLCLSIIYSCGTQKDTATGRAMQNLTARYNYIYNAKVILADQQEALAESYVDNFDQILPVYLGPEVDENFSVSSTTAPSGGRSLDDIIKKAQAIILEKSNSNYIDDAYLLLGKAHFFKGSYFSAAEYFDYVSKAYQKQPMVRIEALNWKAKSMMQLRRLTEASFVLDTLVDALEPLKKDQSEPLATIAQMAIYRQRYPEATEFLKDAIKAGHNTKNKIRWTYILAQLCEQQKKYQEALQHYRRVEKSNAPFEMYFNANLNRIKLNALLSGRTTNKQAELLAMLKDDKNTDYTDQIYYQVAQSLLADGDFDGATKYYKLSIQKSNKNQYQKGLSYLNVADLNFKHYHDYLQAKLYYDSAVNTLPKTYPGYESIVKKNQNLEYLTKRYKVIAQEDTMQMLAKLPEAARTAKIQAMFTPVATPGANTDNNNTAGNTFTGFNNNDLTNTRNQTAGNTFYFSNPSAVSRGFSDFRKKWGNRKLENNWRQSVRSSAQNTIADIVSATGAPATPGQTAVAAIDKTQAIKAYTDSLPLTAQQLAKSDQNIIDSYYEIANFYLQELNDQEEAEEVYQTLLKRFPANSHLGATYYGLYLINQKENPAKAEGYKNILLKDFANSVYAKIILDPSFSMKRNAMETAMNKQYNDIFSQYQQKNFPGVILNVNETMKGNADNYLAPQYEYLKAIAIGRTNNVDSLLTAFNGITTRYPADQLITPLVKEHLTYINAHLDEFRKRKIALPDFDPGESPFAPINTPAPIKTAPVVAAVAEKKPTQKVAEKTPEPVVTAKVPEPVKTSEPAKVAEPVKPTEVVKTAEPEKPKPVKVPSIFSTAVSATYYYVIDVADATLTLSSSRFGIGQFNRGNYAGSNLKHQLKEFDNDQLIYVGNFSNFDDAKTYAEGITPQLKQIMKVPANIYTGFVISKENFDKLTNKDTLNKYLEFYKNNY
jgi:tetratricopeptide (TPR) repeat protein